MENLFGPLFAAEKGGPSGKNAALLKMIMVISSGILSSSAVAAGLKAWFESRRTRLTIQIDGRRKTLTYEGQHLKRDAPMLQVMMEQLGEQTKVVPAVDAVTVSPADEEPQAPAALEAGSHAEARITISSASEQAQPLAPSVLWQRLVSWLAAQKALWQRPNRQ